MNTGMYTGEQDFGHEYVQKKIIEILYFLKKILILSLYFVLVISILANENSIIDSSTFCAPHTYIYIH